MRSNLQNTYNLRQVIPGGQYLHTAIIVLLPVVFIIAFIEELNLLVRVLISGLVALTIWWLPLIGQLTRGEKQHINVSNLLALGFTLLFILPGIYMTLFYDAFEAVRPQYIDFYPQAFALIGMGGCSYLFGYYLFKGKRSDTGVLRNGVEANRYRGRLLVIIVTTICVQWIVRFWLLKSGTFYHTLRTDYQFDNYSILAILYTLESIGYLSIYAFFIMALKKGNRLLVLAILLIIIDLVWVVSGGQRINILRALFSPIVCIWLYKRISYRRGFGILVALMTIVLWVIPLMSAYEYAMHAGHLDPTTLNPEEVAYYLMESQKRIGEIDLPAIDKAVQRLGDIRSLGAVYYSVPRNIDYIYGESYLGILFSFIPHIVWRTKPDYEVRARIMAAIFSWQYASSPLTLVGEAFVNFSFAGVVIVFIIIGIMAKIFDGFVLKRVYVNPWWGALLATEGYRIVWTSMVLGQVVSPILRMMIIAAIWSALTARRDKGEG